MSETVSGEALAEPHQILLSRVYIYIYLCIHNVLHCYTCFARPKQAKAHMNTTYHSKHVICVYLTSNHTRALYI